MAPLFFRTVLPMTLELEGVSSQYNSPLSPKWGRLHLNPGGGGTVATHISKREPTM